MKPTIGRIVHYNEVGGPRAAIVVAVRLDLEGRIDLHVFRPKYDGRVDSIEQAVTEGTTPGTWSWPPRAEVFAAAAIRPPLLDLDKAEPSASYPDMPEPLPNTSSTASDGGGELVEDSKDGEKSR